MSNLNENLFNTCVSPQWLCEALQENVEDSQKIELKDFQAESIGIGAGFLSNILKIKLIWSRKPAESDLPDSVIVKAPTTQKIKEKMADFGVPEQQQEEMLDQMKNDVLKRYHKAECNFYKLASESKALDVLVPKLYFSRDTGDATTGVLVVDDLSESSGLMNFYDGLRMPQVLAVVREIASLHAYCLKNEDWKGIFDVMPVHHFEEWDKFFDRTVQGLRQAGAETLADPMETLRHHFVRDSINETARSHEELHLPPMIVHGDTWIHNLLFKRRSHASSEISDDLEAIIDWQMLHIGNLAEDIAVLLVSSVPTATRRSETRNVLEYYYKGWGTH